ncbi:MAG: hypothetical protein FJY88_13560, partial [Candidatus Eisenbacteria bacterium]|nr:hypothetical protein [Candidatus Eisenbacteria bacterium]
MQRRDKARATDAPRGTLFGASPWIAGALGLLVSLPALGGGFVWDDRWLILQSPVLRDPGNLPRLLMEGHGWGSIILTEDGSAYYRPLATLLHGLLLLLFGAHPLPFRILSGLLHAGTSVVLALLLRRLSPRAMWGAALFAVHPALADAFGWISATPDLLATGLLIGAMAVLFAPRQRPVIVGVLWLFALLSKESSAIGVLWAAILWAALGRFSLDPSGNAGPLRSRSGTVDSPSRPPIASRALPADFSARRALLAIAVATAVYLILRAVGPGFHRPAGEYPAGVEASGATLVGRLWLFNFLSLLVPINPTLNPPAWVIGSAGSGVGLIG